MSLRPGWRIISAVGVVLLAHFFYGSSGSEGSEQVSQVLLALMVILVGAKLGAEFFERFGQPPVLGELLFGVLIGNFTLVGIDVFEFMKTDTVLYVLSEIGVVLLLFEVGLDTTVLEMMKVGLSSFLVAVLGVIVPFALGFGVSYLLLPESHMFTHIFIGATLTATSVGITARVLADLKKLASTEARIILGAAVIDDILGLVILAIVSGVVNSSAQGQEMALFPMAMILVKALLFVGGALVLGRLLSSQLFKIGSFLRSKGMLLVMSMVLCFGMAYLAYAIGLAFIVGAFVAGLIMEEAHYQDLVHPARPYESITHIDELINPLSAFFVPVFFVHTGMSLDLRAFGDPSVLGLAGALTFVAIIGKQICSLGIVEKGLNKMAVGLGMIPRGEVGLVFANIGLQLKLADGSPVVSKEVFAAIIIVVSFTTLAAPPFLKWSFARKDGHQEEIA